MVIGHLRTTGHGFDSTAPVATAWLKTPLASERMCCTVCLYESFRRRPVVPQQRRTEMQLQMLIPDLFVSVNRRVLLVLDSMQSQCTPEGLSH